MQNQLHCIAYDVYDVLYIHMSWHVFVSKPQNSRRRTSVEAIRPQGVVAASTPSGRMKSRSSNDYGITQDAHELLFHVAPARKSLERQTRGGSGRLSGEL